MSRVDNVIWGQPNCTYCDIAKRLLEDAAIPYTYRSLDTMDDKAEFFEITNGARSVPQVVINNRHIGGLRELREFLGDNI